METSVPVSVVVDYSNRTIWFDQTVLSFYDVTVTFFILVFLITCVFIVNAVLKSITRMCVLEEEINDITFTTYFFVVQNYLRSVLHDDCLMIAKYDDREISNAMSGKLLHVNHASYKLETDNVFRPGGRPPQHIGAVLHRGMERVLCMILRLN